MSLTDKWRISGIITRAQLSFDGGNTEYGMKTRQKLGKL